jgi:hypothetical protein
MQGRSGQAAGLAFAMHLAILIPLTAENISPVAKRVAISPSPQSFPFNSLHRLQQLDIASVAISL